MNELEQLADEVLESTQRKDRAVLMDGRDIYAETVEALGYDPLQKGTASASADA